MLYETSATHGYDAHYQGETPTRDQVELEPSELPELDESLDFDSPIVCEYTFLGWDKSISNITAPTTFTAQYSTRLFNGYKVTFLDADDSELYSHYYERGTCAAYPYKLPWSYDSQNVTMFTGWSGSIKDIQEERTVKATYKTISRRQNGEYPEAARVTDREMIREIDNNAKIDQQGYYVYKGERYERRTDNYTAPGSLYYKIVPIHWRVLSSEGGDLFLMSEHLLFEHSFSNHSNDYEAFVIRRYLNEEFLDKAFYYDDSLIQTTAVDNSPASTGDEDNPYCCATTYDKVFLLSYSELTDPELGFAANADRVSGSSTRWYTRSPEGELPSNHSVRIVDDQGDFWFADKSAVLGIRPALHMRID